MRKALLAAGIVALLFVAYAAAGYWLAPGLIRDTLVEQAGRRGLDLQIGEVRTDPFALTVSLADVRVLAQGRELARAPLVQANLGWSSLWSDAWVLQWVAAREPWVEVVIGPEGELNWPRLQEGAPAPAGPDAPEQPPALWVLQELVVNDGSLRFVDRSRGAPVEVNLRAIGLLAYGLSAREGESGSYRLSARAAEGGTIWSEGSVSLQPRLAKGRLAIAAVPLSTLWALAQPTGEPASGRVEGNAAYLYDGERFVLSDLALEATLAAGGEVAASGRLAFGPFAADLRVQASGVPLAEANRWLPQDVAAEIAAGTLAVDGQLHLGPEQQAYEGALAVRDARIEEAGSDELLFGWEALRTDAAQLRFSPLRIHLGEVTAQAPTGRLVLSEQGELNLLQVFGIEEKPQEEQGLEASLELLRIDDGTLTFIDRSQGEDFALTLQGLSGTVAGLGTAPEQRARVELRAPQVVLPSEKSFSASVDGTLSLEPISAELQVALEGVPLVEANRWLPEDVNADVAAGTLSANGRLSLGLEQQAYEGALAVRDARIEEEGSDELLVGWEALRTETARLALSPLRIELGEVVAQAPRGRVVLGPKGELNVLQVLGGEDKPKEDQAPPEDDQAPPQVSLELLRIEDGVVQLTDRSRGDDFNVTVRGLTGTLAGLGMTPDKPARVDLRAPKIVLPSEESFSASVKGTMGLEPISAELQVALEGVPLQAAQRWLPENLAVDIVSGRLSADGRLRVEGLKGTYEGALAVREARLEAPESDELLLGWQLLETDEASLSFPSFEVDLGEVVAHAPAGRLVIDEKGQVNFAQLFPGKEAQGKGKENQGKETQGQQSAEEGDLPFSVRRLRIEDGMLAFADYSLENDFVVTIRELSGTVSGISTAPGEAARLQLTGRVEDYGEVRIRGTINLDQPTSLTNITANFRNIDLAALTPYIVRFAGYRVEAGRVSAELRYRVREGRLVGENDLVFEEVQLGEKVERAGVKELPLELAVALLADPQGRINLDIPVTGDLADPQFDLGGLIAGAFRNVLGKIASAPFRALAAVFGGKGRDLGDVPFRAGAMALTPPAEEDIANVAQALAKRPRLELVIRGAYDPDVDLPALRRQAVRRAIAEAAGVAQDAALDFADPKVLTAAERMYLQRVGNRLQLQALREGKGPYGRAIVQAIAATTPVEPGTAEALARARAQTVRSALVERGVEPGRLRLEEPVRREAGKEGIATQLALDARGAAAAGGTRARGTR